MLFSEDLLNLLEKSTITLAQSVREDVLSLSQCMTSYSNFLKFSNETQQERQSSLVAPKQVYIKDSKIHNHNLEVCCKNNFSNTKNRLMMALNFTNLRLLNLFLR